MWGFFVCFFNNNWPVNNESFYSLLPISNPSVIFDSDDAKHAIFLPHYLSLTHTILTKWGQDHWLHHQLVFVPVLTLLLSLAVLLCLCPFLLSLWSMSYSSISSNILLQPDFNSPKQIPSDQRRKLGFLMSFFTCTHKHTPTHTYHSDSVGWQIWWDNKTVCNGGNMI